ncbi:MAG: DUF3047 domain-containing protein [Victivallaceae bacterium]|nr:DUF3047 domain-containing protein [Victivallaceae bacterium]
MMQIFLFIILTVLTLTTFAEVEKKKWRENFAAEDKEGNLPDGWEINATKWGVNKTSFELKNKKEENHLFAAIGVLKIFSDEATGALFCEPYKNVDLNRTPILRWRWQVNTFPEGGDGRKEHKDDQAIVIYVGASDWMVKKTIAYRWETETPQGLAGDVSYAGGAVKVKWFCLRNRKSGEGKWVVEERNIAKDFKKAFGFIPKEFVLSIGANSQNTKSESLAYIDYIEFLPLDKAKGLEIALKSDKK